MGTSSQGGLRTGSASILPGPGTGERPLQPPGRRRYFLPDGRLPFLDASARKMAALFSSGSVSARTVGLTPASCNASFKRSGAYSVFKLFHSVLRFCPKESLRKWMKPSSSTLRAFTRGDIVSRTTEECTFGGGENAPGGSVKSLSTFAY